MKPSDKITVCYAHETFNLEGEMAEAVNLRIANERQAQHKATWVMAMEAAANAEIPMEKEVSCYNLRKAIKKLSCPPLQITNEKT